MKLTKLLFSLGLFIYSLPLVANNDPCPNPSDQCVFEIPSVASFPHIVQVFANGLCLERNGECTLINFKVRMRTQNLFNNGFNDWLSNVTTSPGNNGSTNIFDTEISWTSQMQGDVLIIEITATHDGDVVAEDTITLRCKDNKRDGCCQLPEGCSDYTTEYECLRMGGIIKYGHECLWTVDRYVCAFLIASGSGTGYRSDQSNTAAPKEELNYEALKATVLPNGNAIRLHLQIPESGSLNIQMYNLAGRRIYDYSNTVNKGHYSRNIQLSEQLSPGIYFLNIRNGNRQITEKFIITR